MSDRKSAGRLGSPKPLQGKASARVAQSHPRKVGEPTRLHALRFFALCRLRQRVLLRGLTKSAEALVGLHLPSRAGPGHALRLVRRILSIALSISVDLPFHYS